MTASVDIAPTLRRHRGSYDQDDRERYRNSLYFWPVATKDISATSGHFVASFRPDMLEAWWQEDVAARLTQFYLDFKAGLRPL
jgi:hypothetical protein